MPGSDASTPAERAFFEFAGSPGAHGEAEFEGLCARHPELSGELRSLHAAWRILAAAAAAGRDPAAAPPPVAQQNVAAVLARMRARGEAWRRYRVLDEVGRGGMGVVSSAFDEDVRRVVAMKVLRDPAGGDAAVARFLDEAQITGQLDHPGIVPVHEIGVDDRGRAFFTMKLVKGETLGDVFERVRRGESDWTVARALGLLLRVCEAMSYAHAKGVIHRDLKPSNVMVGRFGEVYVMDWGLARLVGAAAPAAARARPGDPPSLVESQRRAAADSTGSDPALLTQQGDVLGTPSFMAPEQAEGDNDRLGPSCDVYALGAMIYLLLGGAPPYLGQDGAADPLDVLARVRSAPPEPLSERAPDVPAELVAIVAKAMARRPADRYPTMAELGADLRAHLEDRVVAAHRTGAFAELRMWMRRNAALAGALGAAVVALAAGLAVALLLRARATEAAAEARAAEGRAHRLAEQQRAIGVRLAEQEQETRARFEDAQRNLALFHWKSAEGAQKEARWTDVARESAAALAAGCEELDDEFLRQRGALDADPGQVRVLLAQALARSPAQVEALRPALERCAISPAGRWLAGVTAAGPPAIWLFDLEQLGAPACVPVPFTASFLGFAAEDRVLAADGRGELFHVTPASGLVAKVGSASGRTGAVALSHDRSRLAFATEDWAVEIRNAATGARVARSELELGISESRPDGTIYSSPRALCFSADDRRIFLLYAPSLAVVLDAETGAKQAECRLRREFAAAALGPAEILYGIDRDGLWHLQLADLAAEPTPLWRGAIAAWSVADDGTVHAAAAAGLVTLAPGAGPRVEPWPSELGWLRGHLGTSAWLGPGPAVAGVRTCFALAGSVIVRDLARERWQCASGPNLVNPRRVSLWPTAEVAVAEGAYFSEAAESSPSALLCLPFAGAAPASRIDLEDAWGAASAIALDEAGQRLAFATRSGRIEVRAWPSLERVALREAGPPVRDLALSARGERLAVLSDDGQVALYEVPELDTARAVAATGGAAEGVVAVPGAGWLVRSAGALIELSGAALERGRTVATRLPARLVVAASAGDVLAYTDGSGEVVVVPSFDAGAAWSVAVDGAMALAFSAGGSTLAVGGLRDLALADVAARAVVERRSVALRGVTSVAFSDGEREVVFTDFDQGLQRMRLATPRARRCDCAGAGVLALAATASGRAAVLCSTGELRLLGAPSGTPDRALRLDPGLLDLEGGAALLYLAGGERLALATRSGVALLDAESGAVAARAELPIAALAAAGDSPAAGVVALDSAGRVHHLDAAQLAPLEPPFELGALARITDCAASADGRWLALATVDSEVVLVDRTARAVRWTRDYPCAAAEFQIPGVPNVVHLLGFEGDCVIAGAFAGRCVARLALADGSVAGTSTDFFLQATAAALAPASGCLLRSCAQRRATLFASVPGARRTHRIAVAGLDAFVRDFAFVGDASAVVATDGARAVIEPLDLRVLALDADALARYTEARLDGGLPAPPRLFPCGGAETLRPPR